MVPTAVTAVQAVTYSLKRAGLQPNLSRTYR